MHLYIFGEAHLFKDCTQNVTQALKIHQSPELIHKTCIFMSQTLWCVCSQKNGMVKSGATTKQLEREVRLYSALLGCPNAHLTVEHKWQKVKQKDVFSYINMRE